jgi:hypothetical protein
LGSKKIQEGQRKVELHFLDTDQVKEFVRGFLEAFNPKTSASS